MAAIIKNTKTFGDITMEVGTGYPEMTRIEGSEYYDETIGLWFINTDGGSTWIPRYTELRFSEDFSAHVTGDYDTKHFAIYNASTSWAKNTTEEALEVSAGGGGGKRATFYTKEYKNINTYLSIVFNTTLTFADDDAIVMGKFCWGGATNKGYKWDIPIGASQTSTLFRDTATSLDTATISTSINTDYKMEIIRNDDRIYCILDGVPIFDIVDSTYVDGITEVEYEFRGPTSNTGLVREFKSYEIL